MVKVDRHDPGRALPIHFVKGSCGGLLQSFYSRQTQIPEAVLSRRGFVYTPRVIAAYFPVCDSSLDRGCYTMYLEDCLFRTAFGRIILDRAPGD